MTVDELMATLEAVRAEHGGTLQVARFETMPGALDFAVSLKPSQVTVETMYAEQSLPGGQVFLFEPTNHATQWQPVLLL